MASMPLCLALASLLLPVALGQGLEGCQASDCPVGDASAGPGMPRDTQGMALLQSRVQRDRIIVDSDEGAGGGEGGDLDDCGCRIGVKGWSTTRGRCSSTASTSPREAAWCRSRRSTPAPTPPASGAGERSGHDDCGCRIGLEGWSTTRSRCAPDSDTSSREAAECRRRRDVGGDQSGFRGALDDCGCPAGREGWSSTRSRCASDSDTSPKEAAECRRRAAAPPAVSPPPGPTSPGTLRLMSWNIYFGNHKFGAMADMLGRYRPDVVNLQETNNRLDRIAQASGYVSANAWRRSHDWCGYNFHRSDWSHEWSTEIDVPASRGVCGAMVRRGETRLCVWGLHPVQRGNRVKYSQESIRLAADQMKSCSSRFNAPSIFMGDFNTADWRGAQWQLERSTGWGWSLAAKNVIDFIFIQTSPLSVGRPTSGKVIGRGCIPGFPGRNTVTSSCGYSDHNPVYVEIQLR